MPIINNLTELKSLHSTMSGFFSKMHKAFDLDEDYYDLDFAHALRLPPQFIDDAVVLPTAREVVDTAADHITPEFRRIEVPRRAATPSGTEQARKLQRFYEALLNWLDTQGPISPFREAAKHLPNYGELVGLFLPDIHRIGKEPTQKNEGESDEEFSDRKSEWSDLRKINMPFSLTIVNPTEVLFDPFHDPPLWVMRDTKRFVYDIQRTYPEWANIHRRPNTSQVQVIEYWDDEVRSVMIDGESAFGADIMDNDLGTIPYIVLGSGLGIDDSEHRPEARYVGLLRFLRKILESESRNYSMQDVVIKVGAWPISKRTGRG